MWTMCDLAIGGRPADTVLLQKSSICMLTGMVGVAHNGGQCVLHTQQHRTTVDRSCCCTLWWATALAYSGLLTAVMLYTPC
jgi:hypothetical protein